MGVSLSLSCLYLTHLVQLRLPGALVMQTKVNDTGRKYIHVLLPKEAQQVAVQFVERFRTSKAVTIFGGKSGNVCVCVFGNVHVHVCACV